METPVWCVIPRLTTATEVDLPRCSSCKRMLIPFVGMTPQAILVTPSLLPQGFPINLSRGFLPVINAYMPTSASSSSNDSMSTEAPPEAVVSSRDESDPENDNRVVLERLGDSGTLDGVTGLLCLSEAAKKPTSDDQCDATSQTLAKLLSDEARASDAQMSLLHGQADETSMMVCGICEDRATGWHYGIITCEGCKGFFKRTVQNKRAYTCAQKGGCEINKFQRNRCQYCRFQKCLQKGMVIGAVRQDRMPGGRNAGTIYNVSKLTYRKKKDKSRGSESESETERSSTMSESVSASIMPSIPMLRFTSLPSVQVNVERPSQLEASAPGFTVCSDAMVESLLALASHASELSLLEKAGQARDEREFVQYIRNMGDELCSRLKQWFAVLPIDQELMGSACREQLLTKRWHELLLLSAAYYSSSRQTRHANACRLGNTIFCEEHQHHSSSSSAPPSPQPPLSLSMIATLFPKQCECDGGIHLDVRKSLIQMKNYFDIVFSQKCTMEECESNFGDLMSQLVFLFHTFTVYNVTKRDLVLLKLLLLFESEAESRSLKQLNESTVEYLLEETKRTFPGSSECTECAHSQQQVRYGRLLVLLSSVQSIGQTLFDQKMFYLPFLLNCNLFLA